MTKHLCDACKGDIDDATDVLMKEQRFELCTACANKLFEILRVKHSFRRGRPVKSKADRTAWQAA